MITDILPEFQEFLLSHKLVSEKNIPFYALWVSKFISFMNGNPDIPEDSALLAFLEQLPKQRKIEDWQLQQAEEAVKLYQGHFLKAEKHGNEDRSIHITNIAQILDEMRGRALWICFMPANDRIGPGQNIAKIFASHKNKELSRRLPPLLSFLADRKPLHSTFPASTISRNVHY